MGEDPRTWQNPSISQIGSYNLSINLQISFMIRILFEKQGLYSRAFLHIFFPEYSILVILKNIPLSGIADIGLGAI